MSVSINFLLFIVIDHAFFLQLLGDSDGFGDSMEYGIGSG